MQILEENSTNWLVMTEEGSTATKTKDSDLNKLLYGHGLFGLLDEGSEIWTRNFEGEPKLTIIPDDNAECFTLRIGDYPDLVLGAQHKTDLIDAMAEMFQERDGESIEPILNLYERVRDNMVRQKVLRPFIKLFSDKVVEQDNGWFINDHLLLDYEGDFYHPNNVSRNRSGSVIGEGTSIEAYGITTDSPSADMDRDLTIDGQKYRLTDSEVDFLARAVWAVKNTPDKT